MVRERTRRDFLVLAGKSLGLAALSSTTVASLLKNVEAATKTVAHLTPEEAAINEDYWAIIQNSFTVTRGIINLNNGGVSPSPQIVTEALVRYQSRNRKRSVPDWRSCSAAIAKRSRSRAMLPSHSRFF